MKLLKHVDATQLKSRDVFNTDADYQLYAKKLMVRLGLDDGYAHAVSLSTGAVYQGGKMKLTEEKISKSNQP